MERMVESRNIKHIVCVERIKQLEEENRKLKEEIKKLEFDVDAWHQLKLLLEGEIEKLNEENKKLKERIDELEKCNLNLQERLDNKEKVNKSLREELSKKGMETWFNEKAENIFTEEGTLQ